MTKAHERQNNDSGSIEFQCDRGNCGKTYRNQSELHRNLDIHDNFFEKCFFLSLEGPSLPETKHRRTL